MYGGSEITQLKTNCIFQEDPSWLKPKGVLQRNEGLFWIRENVRRSIDN